MDAHTASAAGPSHRPTPAVATADTGSTSESIDLQHTPVPDSHPSGSALATSPSNVVGSVARLQAIAKLRRAASTREMRGEKTGGVAEQAQEGHSEIHGSPDPAPARRGPEVIVLPGSPVSPNPHDGHPTLLVHGTVSDSNDPSPGAVHHSGATLQSPGTSSPVAHMALSRSASASRAENRSPLPTLEQLRSRILHERLTAGLQRSVSASAASAAARAYAMNKLLGEDAVTREGATSPVSDSGHGWPGVIEEEEDVYEEPERLHPDERSLSDDDGIPDSKRRSKRTGNHYLRPPSLKASSHYRSLRRSRTISGMSQRAEDERKAAFQKDLDLVEERAEGDDTSIRRRKRMSRLPARGTSTSSGGTPEKGSRAEDAPRALRKVMPQDSMLEGPGSQPLSAQHSRDHTMPGQGLQRQPSQQREAARTQMMRKLSGRRLGGPSPVPPSDSAGTPDVVSSIGHYDHSNGHEGGRDDFARSPMTPSEELEGPLLAKNEDGVGPENGQMQPFGVETGLHVGYGSQFDATNAGLTAEQRMAFLQMQQLLQEQQLQIHQAASSASFATAAAEMDQQRSLAETFGSPGEAQGRETAEDTSHASSPLDQNPSSSSPLQAARQTVPQTPNMGGAKHEDFLGPSVLVTPGGLFPSPSNSTNTLGQLQASQKTLWDSPGAASNVSQTLIPSIQFATRATGVPAGPMGRALPDWPTSPTSSSLGFGGSEEGEGVAKRRLDSGFAWRKNSAESDVKAVDQQRESQPNQQPEEDERAQAATIQPTLRTQREVSALLAPPVTGDAPMSATSASFYSTYSPDPGSSLSRLSRATSAGVDGDHFAYESLLAGHSTDASSSTSGVLGARNSRLISPIASMPGVFRQQQSERSRQLARHEDGSEGASASKSVAGDQLHPVVFENLHGTAHGITTRETRDAVASSPLNSGLSATDRSGDKANQFAEWAQWMQAQGMDVSDIGSPGGTAPARSVGEDGGKADSGKLRLPPLNTQAMGDGLKRELVVDLSPSLIKEFGADIEWPARLRALPGAGGFKATTLASSEKASSADEVQAADHPSAGSGRTQDSPQSVRHVKSAQALTVTAAHQHSLEEDDVHERQQHWRAGPTKQGLEQDVRAAELPAQHHRMPRKPAEKASSDGSNSDPLVEGLQQRLEDLNRNRAATTTPQDSSLPRSSAVKQVPSSQEEHLLRSKASEERHKHAVRDKESLRGPPPSAWPGNDLVSSFGVQTDKGIGSTATVEPRPAPTAGPAFRTLHHRLPSASDFETQSAYANDKLNPFPGLFHRAPGGRMTPLPSASGERDAASAASASGSQSRLQSSSPRPEQDHATDNLSNGSKGTRSLFGSLRRKASAVVRNGSLRRKGSNITPYDVNSSASPRLGGDDTRPGTALSTTKDPPAPIDHLAASQSQSKPANDSRAPAAQPHGDNDRLAGSQEQSTSHAQPGLAPRQAPPATTQQLGNIAPTPEAVGRGEEHRETSVASVRLEQRVESPREAVTTTAPASNDRRIPLRTASRGFLGHAHSRASSVTSLNSSRIHGSELTHGAQSNRPAAPTALGDDSLDTGGSAPATSVPLTEDSQHLRPDTTAMLHRYSRVLTSSVKADKALPAVPGLTAQDVESPPRQLLKVSPVFQVASASTIKDRFLLLFNDILLIAKPIAPPVDSASDEKVSNIRWIFEVKNIIELRHVTLNSSSETRQRAQPHPLQETFVRAFVHDPEGALHDIITTSGLAYTPKVVAQLLAQTPGLDEGRRTQFLGHHSRRDVLDAFVKLQRVTAVSIESALRSFLLEMRFPRDAVAFEAILLSFSSHWVEENKDLIKDNFTKQLAADLVFAMMALNDALHGQPSSDDSESDADTFEDSDYEAPGIFSETMRSLSKTAFLHAFRAHDPELVLSDRTLLRIYSSIKLDPIQQALRPDERQFLRRISVSGGSLPLKLVYGVTSEPISVSLPRKDSDFALRLYGQDLQFEPPILNFASSKTQTFTVTSRALGTRQAVFVRAGRRARFYSGSHPAAQPQPDGNGESGPAEGPLLDTDLPKTASFLVERAFMQHSFSFTAPTATTTPTTNRKPPRRKFLFSVGDAASKQAWVDLLHQSIQASNKARGELQRHIAQGGTISDHARARRAAFALTLHVLRQALIGADDRTGSHAASSGLDDCGEPALQRSVSSSAESNRPALATTRKALHTRAPSDSRFVNPVSSRALQQNGAAHARNASVSQHYYAADTGAGKEERVFLGPSQEWPQKDRQGLPDLHAANGSSESENNNTHPPVEADKAEPRVLRGEDLVTVCVQNSLLPLLLERTTVTGEQPLVD
ncbi:unnamed protein product [Parajaminaea phylloscopi]